MRRSRVISDDSSPASESERRKKVGDYNEATFGQRRPFVTMFLWVGLAVVVAMAMVLALPRGVGRILGTMTVGLVVAWQNRRG